MTQKKTPATTKVMTSAPDSAIVAGNPDADKLAREVVRFETGEPTRQALALVIHKDEARIDSRLLAAHLKKKRHQDLFELVKRYESQLRTLGVLLFQTGKPTPESGGRPERFALLNEDQAYFVLTLSRNTPAVVALKLRLVKAFGEARRAAQAHGAEYLPTYHALHDQLHALPGDDSSDRFIHMNVNKLVNKVAGIEAGQRAQAALPQQSMLIVAQAVAARVAGRATDQKAGYQQIKAALVKLSRAALIEGVPA